MPRYLSAESRAADDFGVPMTKREGEVVYDAATRGGPWACMTERSWRMHGRGMLGLGRGQKYQRNAAGELHKVEG